MGVVTNKQHRFAVALLRMRGLDDLFGVVVGGDSCERRKPDPQPLQWAASQLGVPDSAALMVGDSVNDVTAALAAGMAVVCVPYGYNEGQDVRQLPAHAFVETLAELPRLLGL
jgi:phosphoglycolate phosphatase